MLNADTTTNSSDASYALYHGWGSGRAHVHQDPAVAYNHRREGIAELVLQRRQGVLDRHRDRRFGAAVAGRNGFLGSTGDYFLREGEDAEGSACSLSVSFIWSNLLASASMSCWVITISGTVNLLHRQCLLVWPP